MAGRALRCAPQLAWPPTSLRATWERWSRCAACTFFIYRFFVIVLMCTHRHVEVPLRATWGPWSRCVALHDASSWLLRVTVFLCMCLKQRDEESVWIRVLAVSLKLSYHAKSVTSVALVTKANSCFVVATSNVVHRRTLRMRFALFPPLHQTLAGVQQTMKTVRNRLDRDRARFPGCPTTWSTRCKSAWRRRWPC